MTATVRRRPTSAATRIQFQTGSGHGNEGTGSHTWPVAELDPRWPHLDPRLARWRYRRIMQAIDAREEQCLAARPRRRDGARRTPREEWNVVITVPVSVGWRRAPDQTAIAAYGCTGSLLTGNVTDGTVLATFLLDELRQAIRQRLRALTRPQWPAPICQEAA